MMESSLQMIITSKQAPTREKKLRSENPKTDFAKSSAESSY